MRLRIRELIEPPPDDLKLVHRSNQCRYEDGRWTCWPDDTLTLAQDHGEAAQRDLELLRIASEHFRHDLTAFWTHSSFFLVIQAALLSVFATIIGPRDPARTESVVSVAAEATLLAVAGLLMSGFWAWVAFRRKVLIEVWRQQVMHLDGAADRHEMYLRVEPHVAGAWWYGPTAFTATLPLLVIAIWIAALLLIWLA